METIPVLYDGWPLLHRPNGPAAMHLLATLARLPAAVSPHLALPGERPPWLPADLPTHILPAAGNPWDAVRWEQLDLPRLAARLGALIHVPRARPAFFARVPRVISPTSEDPSGHPAGVPGRVASALAQGAMSRVQAVLWPEDLPAPAGRAAIHRLPPCVHPAFLHADEAPADLAAYALPPEFVLYHGPLDERTVGGLVTAWSWAAGAISTLYPLVVVGADAESQARLHARLTPLNLRETVVVLPKTPPDVLPAVYGASRAVFHPAPISPWGGALRAAMVSGRPIVAAENPISDALVGAAAYLVPAAKPRRLGAALITVLVEEEVADRLARAGEARAAAWEMDRYGERLLSVYRQLAGR